MKNRKLSISKIIFWCSFIPYIVIILISLYYAINGHDVKAFVSGDYIRTDYGLTAFLNVGLWLVCWSSMVVPIIPIMFIYQIIFIVCYVIRGFKRKENK